MKGLDFFKCVAVFTAFCAFILFVAGCSDDDSSGGSTSIPSEPPSVSGGNLTRIDGRSITTQTEYNDFLSAFRAALSRSYTYSSSNNSSVQRAIPEEYEKGSSSGKFSFTESGYYSGRVEVAGNSSWNDEHYIALDEEIRTGYSSTTYKFFDFSNHSGLILGGSVGILKKSNQSGNGYTTKANGVINFAGKYHGKIVFNNVTVLTIFNGSQSQSDIISGSFYVQSQNPYSYGGGDDVTNFDLHGNLVYNFSIYTNKITVYPDEKITLTMPAVPNPNVTDGYLFDRSGIDGVVQEPVTEENINAFLKAFTEETDYLASYPRAANEYKETWERLTHGKANGYYTQNYNYTEQANTAGQHETATGKTEYYDYSNKHILYLGGGYGKASIGRYKQEASGWYEMTEYQLNGKVPFNGRYTGIFDFQNFRYRELSNISNGYNAEISHISGSVKIGGIDVTEKYLKYVLNGEPIPNDPTQPPVDNTDAIVGVWYWEGDAPIYDPGGNENWSEIPTYRGRYTCTFNSDGTGTLHSVADLSDYDEGILEFSENFTWVFFPDQKYGIIYTTTDVYTGVVETIEIEFDYYPELGQISIEIITPPIFGEWSGGDNTLLFTKQ
ncbi:MAG: hypothetical protein FWF51_03335 [Chitinivibrionia bacterium]|nr:hypothetical protein [Chitinivibrionia bacterium]